MTKEIICRDISGEEYLALVDQLTFRPAVYGVIIQDNKILLTKIWDGYDLPGGGIDIGENIGDALAREVKEETGYEVKLGRVLYCTNSFFKLPHSGKFVHSIRMYYQCRIIGGELSTAFLDQEEMDAGSVPEWINLEDIGNIRLFSPENFKNALDNVT